MSARRRPPPSNQRIILIVLCLLLGLGLAQYGSNLFSNVPQASFLERTATLGQLYDIRPDLQTCQVGQLRAEEKTRLLNHINAIRRIHQLPPLLLDPEGDRAIAAVALARAANPKTAANTPAPQRCATGLDPALETSSLGYQVYQSQVDLGMGAYRVALPTSESMIDALLQDHRRGFSSTLWLLNPFAEMVQMGRADGETDYRRTENITRTGEATEDQIVFTSEFALHIEIPEAQSRPNVPSFIVYPRGDYPQRLFRKDAHQLGYPYMLLSIPDPQRNIDFSQVQIEIQDPEGQLIPIRDKKFSQTPTVLGHYLAWRVDDLEPETWYSVRVLNVQDDQFNNPGSSFGYGFRLVRE